MQRKYYSGIRFATLTFCSKGCIVSRNSSEFTLVLFRGSIFYKRYSSLFLRLK